MKKGAKILSIWGCLMLGVALSLLSQKHMQYGIAPFLINSFESLIAIISLFLALSDPSKKNRFLFLNFFFVFLFSLVFLFVDIVSPMLSAVDKYLPFIAVQYVKGLYYAVFSFAVVYLVLDSLFRDLRVAHKYIATLIIVGGFFGSYFSSFLVNPRYGYTTPDIRDFLSVDKVHSNLVKTTGREPSAEEMASLLTLPAWHEDQPVGSLYPDKNLLRIKEIQAYIPGDNYSILLYKPINLYVIKMNILSGFFIILFFGYQYRKDPPQGAYIDKIMFLLLLFCSMEVFHAWSFIHTVEWEEYLQIFVIGQYVSIFILLLIAAFFGLRLRFVTSVAGEFYENELVHSAQHITRWRDWLDNIVLHYFFNPKAVRGVFFSQRTKE